MQLARRVKEMLSWDAYRKLDKNNRLSPEGEVVPTHDELGRELPDPVPVAPPVGWFKQPSMFDQVRQMVRSEQMRMYAEAQGDESFDEANDFDVDDEMFPSSQYEGEYLSAEELAHQRQMNFRSKWLAERERREMEEDLAAWDGRTLSRTARDGSPEPQDPPLEREAPAKPARSSSKPSQPASDAE